MSASRPSRQSRRDGHLRREVAQMAARLLASDGARDYAEARHKAMRCLGLEHQRLDGPDEAEIEAALRAYQALYQADSQPAHVRQLRTAALQLMDTLAAFQPRLIGRVLSGTASAHSPVEIELFADSAKDLEIDLRNRRLRFVAIDAGQVHFRPHSGPEARLSLETPQALFILTVYPRHGRRSQPAESQAGPMPAYAELDALRRLLQAPGADSDAGD